MANYKELLAQREALDKQIEELRAAELRSAVAHVRQLVAEWGLSPEDCGFKSGIAATRKQAKSTSVVAAKYRGPNGEIWSGRGRAPKWLVALEAEGRQRAEFSIS
jgi:DNA-binding protein H-NS